MQVDHDIELRRLIDVCESGLVDVPQPKFVAHDPASVARMSRLDGLAVEAGREWTGVVRISDGSVSSSGVLLDSGIHILTAAHLLDDFSLATGQVHFQDGTTLDSRSILQTETYADFRITGSGVWHDLGLVTLDQAAPVWATRYAHSQDRNELGQIATIVGYGRTQTPGGEVVPQGQHLRQAGTNLVEATASSLFNSGARGSLSEQLVFDYDDGTPARDALGHILGMHNLGTGRSEAMITKGDSGGGLFLQHDGDWILGGISSYIKSGDEADLTGEADGSIGGLGFATRVSGYADWIDFQTGMTQTPQAMDGPPPPLNQVPPTVTEGQAVWFLVALDAPASQPTSVDFFTRDGTAVAGQDYIPTQGRLVLEPGEQWTRIWVQTLADDLLEEEETFHMVLANPEGAAFPGGVDELMASRAIFDDISLTGVTDLSREFP